MKADYLTYRRGTTVSITGFLIQLLLTLVFLIYSQYGQDHAALTAAMHLGIGLLAWATLGLMFDLHRRERLEDLEIEAIGKSGASSAFDSSEGELRPAAQRLAAMQKFFVPGVSLLIAALLLGFGWLRLTSGRSLVEADDAVFAKLPGWGISIGIGTAFVGFVFARFVAGMAKQRVWSSLRGGAAFAVGSALFGLALALAHFIAYATKEDIVLRYLPVIFPLGMLVLGLEVIFSFALNLYRPRRPGEDPRAAFDSRVLGFLAAPDKIAESIGEAINYQFGVDVAGTWFYRLLSRWVLILLVLAVGTTWLLTSFVVIQPHQRAMILTWGEISRRDVGPGLTMKWPWPISTVEIPEYQRVHYGDDHSESKGEIIRTASGVRVIHLGSNPPTNDNKPILWTTAHALNETLMIVQTSTQRAGRSEGGIDPSLVAVEVPLHYTITNVELYDQFASPAARDEILKGIGRREVMRYLSTLTIDDVLGASRTRIAADLRQRLDEAYSQLNGGKGAGIEILFVGAEGVHPPQAVAIHFEGVVQEKQRREAAIEDAQRYKIEVLSRTAGSVGRAERIAAMLDELDVSSRSGGADEELAAIRVRIQHELEQAGGQMGARIIQASAQRWTRHMHERGLAALHQGQVASYNAAPELYRAKQYFAALREAMKDARVYVVPEELAWIRFQLEDQGTTNIFDPSAGAPQ